MAGAVVDMNSVLGRLDPVVVVLHLRGNLGDLSTRVGKRLLVVDLQQRPPIASRQAVVRRRRVHDAARRVMLLNRAARVRADMDGEHVGDAQAPNRFRAATP